MNSVRCLQTSLWLAGLLVAGVRAGEPTPTPPDIKVPPPVITVKTNGANVPLADLNPAMADFQSADPIRQESGAKALIDAGFRGYNLLGALLKSTNQDLVKRATDGRQKIDARSWQMFQDTQLKAEKNDKEPMTVKGLEEIRQAWMAMASYASQPALRQHGIQSAQGLQKTISAVQEAMKTLTVQDELLKAKPEPQEIMKASIQIERARAFQTLHQYKEALAATDDVVAASGKDGRLTPAALKLQVELQSALGDKKAKEAVCRNIIQNYSRCLEVKDAYSELAGLLNEEKRWDESFSLVKNFVAAFPVDEGAQEAAYSLMETLEEEHEYIRVNTLALWLDQTLPPDRVTMEVTKLIGGCSEYILKDFARAKTSYLRLRSQFPDVFSTADMDLVIQRIDGKIAGTFAKEPAETDEGPAGVLAKFLKAVRTRDAKAASEAVPKDMSDATAAMLTEEGEEAVPQIVFADFVVKKTEVDPKGAEATVTLDYYDASGAKPKAITQKAVKENDVWKIKWSNDDLSSEEGGAKLEPAPPAKAPVGPQKPPAPNVPKPAK